MNKKDFAKKMRLKISKSLFWMSDKAFLKMIFKLKTHHKLNLKNPTKFTDKLNWLKLNHKHLEYSEYVDKIKARQKVIDRIGEKYLIPIYGTWDKFQDIDFDNLPNEFVLKCNHDSGSVTIIRDKSVLTKKYLKKLKKFYNKRLKWNLYYMAREYPYKNVKPMIYAEKLIVDESKIELKDYKFFCFYGEPKLFYIASNRGPDTRFDFYDMDCNHLDIFNIHKNADNPPKGKPPYFDEMIRIAKELSKGFPFIRIDLYSTNDGPKFGEFTIFHGAGLYLFEPEKWEYELGKFLDLSKL